MDDKLIKILAIDDNSDNLIIIKALLGESFPDISVITATSGQKGIEMATQQSPAVILLDVVMPDMDGFEVCKILKSSKVLSGIPVVFVTALKADKESRIQALELGAEGFLAKPIDESELVAQIRSMLKIRQANLEKENENVRLAALVAERTKELKQTHTATLNLLEDLRNENEAKRLTVEALAESQTRLIRAEFASKSGNWELHLDMKIVTSSEGASMLYGISKKENVYEIVKEIPLPEYREILDKALIDLIEKDVSYNLEYKIKKVDTGEIVDIHSIAFFDKERRIVFGIIQDITERKQAQQALHESEELYRSVINASPDNITVTDLSGNILMISPNGLGLTGYTDQKLLLGRNISEFVIEEDRIRARENIQNMFQGVLNGSEEYGLVRADGSIVFTEINAEFVKDILGEPKRLVFAIRDITERKQAQDAIRESERKYRLITEKISDVVWILDMSGQSLFVSQSVENFTGYTVEEYLAQSIHDRFTPESAQIALFEMKASFESLLNENLYSKQLSKILILDYICKDGRVKTGELLVTPYWDDNNKLIGVHGVTRDVTERKRAEDSLRISEEKYRFMAENSSDVIWHTNTDFIFDYVSPAQERLNGYKPEEIVGQSLWNLLNPEDIERVKSEVTRHKAKKEKVVPLNSFKFEFEVLTRAGVFIWVDVSVSVHMDDNGDIIGYHGVTRDITERKNAQKELGQSEEKYRLLVENSPNGIAIYQEGKFVYVNKAGLKIFGTNKDTDLLGKPILSIVHPDSMDAVIKRVSEVATGSEVPPIEEKLIRFDGSVFDAEVTALGTTFNGKPAGQVIVSDITERKIAAERLKESEEKFRDMAELLPQVVFEMTLAGEITYVNKQTELLFGYNTDELIGKNSLLAHMPEDDERIRDGISKKMAGIHVEENEFTMRRKDGSVFPALVYINLIVKDNQSVGIRGVIVDITVQKEAEIKIKESQLEYYRLYSLIRLMSDTMPDMLWSKDLDGNYTFANKAMCERLLHAVDTNEPVGKPDIFFAKRERDLHPDNPKWHTFGEICFDTDKTTIDAMKKMQFDEYGMVQGEFLYLDVHKAPLLNENNELIGVVGTARDITERKKAEDALRVSEEKFRFMAENTGDVVWHMSMELQFDYLSPSIERVQGYKPDELIGKSLFTILNQEGINQIQQEIDRFNKEPNKKRDVNQLSFEYETLCKDGNWIWVEVNVTLHLGKDMKPIGFHGVTRDITDRKKAASVLMQTRQNYETFFNTIDEFLFVLDEQGNIIYVNTTVINRLGYSTEELYGQSVLLVHPEDRREEALRIIQNMLNGSVESCPVPLVTKFNTQIPVETRVTHGFWNGKPVIFGVTKDITQIILSEEKFSKLFKFNPSAAGLSELGNSNYIEVNEAFYKLFGYNELEVIGRSPEEIGIFGNETRNSILSKMDNEGMFTDVEVDLNAKNGVVKHVILSSQDIEVQNNKYRFTVLNDITDRKIAEEKLNYVTRLYALLSHVNEAIVRIKDEEELLRTICELAIEYGQFRMCWIGIYDEEADVLEPKTFAGYDDGYLTNLTIRPHQVPYTKGPTGRSFLEKRMIFCNDIATDPDMKPWKVEAGKRGYKSSFATPIYRKGIPYGSLTLYASVSNFFNEEEQKLLSEISNNLSYAIDALDVELDRKLAEEALIQSEAKYREFVENSPEAIAIYSDNVVTYVNRECLRLMRANSKDELIGMSVIDFIHPDNRQIVIERMMKAAVSEVDISLPLVEEKYIRLDGTPIYVEVKVMPLMLDGKPAFQLTARDVSDRKIIENALEQSRIELKAIYDNAPVMMCVVDENRRIMFANNAFNSLTGISEEIIGGGAVGGVIGCINSLDDPRGCGHGPNCKGCSLRIAMENTFNTGIDRKNVEYHSFLNIDGVMKEVFLLGSTALIQTAEHNSLLLCLHDITDRKVAEDALYKSEMILRTFIDNIPFDIWARDINTVGILENKKMVDHFGSIIGKKTSEVDRDKDEIELYNSINDRAFRGEIVDDEYDLIENGLAKYYRQIVFPIYDRTKVSGIASINIDITERKQFEKALDESQEQLKKFAAHLQSVREEERLLLAREIHDELGQILIAMKIDMGLLRQYVMKNVVDDAFTLTVEKFNNLLSLVDNTIQTARRIMTDLRPEVLDLLGFVDAVKQYVAKYEERYKIRCEFHATDAPVEINSDQSVALFRIVQEALNNISKHAKATKISINIDLVQHKYVVEIIDNGVGFDMKKKTRSDSYGLIGMKERVFLLGATLDIQSEIGKGTTIRVLVPKSDLESNVLEK